MSEVILVDKLSFSYYPGVPVLENVGFSVQSGEFLGLIGPNGGGKTTLLKILLGILPVQQGKVKILGVAPHDLRARLAIGYVPQQASVPKNFPATVHDILEMGMEGKRFLWHSIAPYQKKLAALSEAFGLQKLLRVPICEISGGQMRRVFLVRALMREPALLVLDEPMAGVDSSGNILFFDFIHDLCHTNNIALLMTSHDVDILRAKADRLMCLNHVVHFCDSAHLISANLLHHTYNCELETFYHNRDYHIFKTADQPCEKQPTAPDGERPG